MMILALLLVSGATASISHGRSVHVTMNVNGTVNKSTNVLAKVAKVELSPVVGAPSGLGLAAVPAEKAKVAAVAKPTKVAAAPVPKAMIASSKAKARINPPLEDVASDKKFFGPPFPADYPDDKRPAVDQKLLSKLKGPDQPYPALQSKDDYDKDFVKDENADKGQWKAQMEYDALRRKLAKENGDANGAADRAGKEGRDVDGAAARAEKARRDAEAAKKALEDANKAADDAERDAANKKNGDGGADGADGKNGADGANDGADDKELEATKENLEKLKKMVKEAEDKYEQEKKQFEECKRKLEEAKKNLDELKAKQVEMEKALDEQTKLWVETKAVRLNLQHSKEDAAHAKKLAAVARLQAAQAAQAEMDQILADKKALHEKALKHVQEKKANVGKSKAALESATETLQKLRGYKPAAPAKSGAAMSSTLFSLAVLLMHMF